MPFFTYDFPIDLTVGDEEWVRHQLAHCPPWLLREWGERLETLLGGLKGEAAELAKQAVKARMVELAPSDAVDDIGADHVIVRAPAETETAYRARVRAAWAAWEQAGREAGILALLSAAGCSSVTVVEDQDVAGALGHWARFYVWIVEPHPFVAPLAIGSGITVGTGWTIGFGDRAVPEYVRATVKRWRPSHTRCLGVAVNWATVSTPSVISIEPDDIGVGTPDPATFGLTNESYQPLLMPEGDVLTDGTASA